MWLKWEQQTHHFRTNKAVKRGRGWMYFRARAHTHTHTYKHTHILIPIQLVKLGQSWAGQVVREFKKTRLVKKMEQRCAS